MAPLTRKLEVADASALAALEEASQELPWSADQLFLELVHPDALVLAMEGDGVLLAHVCVRRLLDELWVLNLAVLPSERRRGHARDLLAQACAWGVTHSARAAWLEVREHNVGARALYGSLGFVERGRRARYYRPIPPATLEETAIVMEAALPLTFQSPELPTRERR